MGDSFARKRLLGMVSGGVLAQCCYAAAELGVADLLAGGARPVAELAAECGADPVALDRLLSDLAHFGLFRHSGADGYALTSVGELLRTDVPGSLRQTAIMHGEEVARAFVAITHTLRTGRPAFDEVHGLPFYDYLNDHPVVANTMAEAMGTVGPPPVLAGYRPLERAELLVDIGGGDGGLLAAVLTAHPTLRGVLLELPGAIRAARARLADAGLLDRAELVQGSFFDGVPPGGDVYVLARVLHNWADEHAVAILRRVRQVMTDRSRLIVLERFRSPAESGSVTTAMVDLLMLGLLEGRQRTEDEYVALLDQAGF
jgi:hypothetical protein